MKRKKIVAGNWKMNMNIDESKNLVSQLKEISALNVDIKIAPSFTNLYLTNSLLESSKIDVISQDLHHEQSGAYTGEISADMLLSIGVKTSIVGHSERRKYFNESDIILSKKVNTAIQNSMNVIFCIGEELSERNNNNHFKIIKSQLLNGIFHLEVSNFQNIIIAYEPVWAIGTGMTASSNQIQEMHEFIRNLIKSNYGIETSESVRILYGGSVKPNNAKEIFSLEDVDGGLIGGASLNASDFSEIVKAADE